MRIISILMALAVLLLLLPTSPGRTENKVVIQGVPFVKQKDKFCGPAALASVMRFYGRDVTQGEIAEAVYIPELNGALISDIENYASASGFKTKSSNGDIEALKALIDENIPVILLVDKGKWKVSSPHYYVVYGYDEERREFIVHDGYGSGKQIGYEKLDGEWEKMNRLMLVVSK